ncbi:YidB family protein [Devosia sp. SL43]|uniref:YidB family protein n=1 Tax=Devosia sp. SL43 TaxID=2806348 RepID=UPI001F45FEA0|nr:YidB family protein [Devosia sp. SL43]
MVALLGLLAVAGYQNRDKLGGLLNGLGSEAGSDGANHRAGGLGDLLNGLGGGSAGSILSGGLGDLVDRFRQSGRGDTADSWVKAGDNAPLQASDLEATLGEDTIAELTQKTGLSRAEVLDRLSSTLPDAVNQMTPEGRLPTEAEASRFA